ncbi:hypothetical protein [Thiomicrorhabdus sp.]|uniref:hypothetical protein n=1 Tax=Thiomicrorhabdus sp. TaxID=2039724 RepID=UPI0029C8374A|nr:hypothetical protein [Thiomicrorhabdus sp.]
MEIILILVLLVFLSGILLLAVKLFKWILGNKIRSWGGLGVLIFFSIGFGIEHFFFRHMLLMQSEVYPNLYLAKYYENDENQLHSLIREKIKNHLSNKVPVGKKLNYQKENVIFFYAYYKVFPLSVFQDAGTAYFIENEEDLGGFVTEELGMYSRYKLAEFYYAPCESKPTLYCGKISYFKNGNFLKSEHLTNLVVYQNLGTSTGIEFFIERLQLAYSTKDEESFLNQFPSDFEQFVNVFGWDEQANRPNNLYEESDAYINYFFALISNEKYQDYEKKVISIAKEGKWQADAANYFQDKALAYIKDEHRYHLINEVEYLDAKSVLFFLFDGPHPKFDKTFTHSLNNDKMHIVYDLFANEFTGWDKSLNSINEDFSYYVDNENYFIREIDVNNDYAMDKIVSAKPYQADDLLVFINSDGVYRFAFKTTNFSQDGGQQIVDVIAEKDGFYIHTRFPDRGLNEAYHHIAFTDGKLILTNTVFKFQKSNEEGAPVYTCDIKQGVDFSNPNLLNIMAPQPNESERQPPC